MIHNLEAEQGVLGAILNNNRLYDDLKGLSSDDFMSVAHARLYTLMERQISSGKTCDAVTIAPYFDKEEELKNVGGAEYIKELQYAASAISNPRDYAATVISDSYRRRVLQTVNQIKDYVENPPDILDKNDYISQLESLIGNTFKDTGEGYSLAETLEHTFKYIDGAIKGDNVFYPTYFTGLNKQIAGLRPQALYILAGRPAMGKTALALNMATYAAQSCAVKFFSLEMPKEELAMRQLASLTGVSVQKQMKGEITSDEMQKLLKANDKLAILNMNVDDRSGVDVHYIMSESRRFARKNKNSAIFIDYLGLIRSRNQYQNKNNQVEEITRSLKELAKEINAPVILLSQLSREVEKREDKRPMLADLRDSGAIEQDADVVMFAFREEYYKANDEPKQKKNEGYEKFAERLKDHQARLRAVEGKAEIIVSKNRQGTLGVARLTFDGLRQRFDNE